MQDKNPARSPFAAADGTESADLKAWQQAGEWISYDGHKIFTHRSEQTPGGKSPSRGRGKEALLLLHGFPSASWDWHRVWPQLSKDYHLLACDMLGLGFSDKPVDYNYSITEQADIHQGWLEQLGIRHVHLLAHDYGSSVAQELMARDQEGSLPFTIGSVCLLNGALCPEVHRPIMLQRLLLGPLGGLVSRALTRRVFENNLCKIFGPDTQPTRANLEDFWQLLIHNNGQGVIHRLIHYMEERRCHRHRWVGALQHARQPVRLIWGQADPVSGQAMQARYRELVPEGDVVPLLRIGHYPHFEAPALVVRHYQDFRKLIADTAFAT
ncbi:MAG: alpha/beta hydrolase [Halomonadaceae bacterium]|nr:MAG: alpha/beta hydrolase [Halomonadaceae bacterium]